MKYFFLICSIWILSISVFSQSATDIQSITLDSLKSYIETTNQNLPQEVNEAITLAPYSIDTSLTMNFTLNEDFMIVDDAFCNAFRDNFSYGFFSSINSTMKSVLSLTYKAGLSFSIKATGNFANHTCIITYSNSELKHLLSIPERPIR
ncbi:MAG: hypothetical protein K6D57_05015 [Paludibacteraceae bacterium]|nr:hypothetical protein [Paludibacteraceae bacterium]